MDATGTGLTPEVLDDVALSELSLARAAFIHAVRHRDAAALAALYGEDARVLAPAAAPLRGREDAAAFWEAGVDSGVTDIELDPEDVERLSSAAWEVGRYALRLQPSTGPAVVDRGRYLLVYRLDAGSWHRAAEMFVPDERTESPGRDT